ncbi:MAG TPA: hypothetical protein VNK24_08920 [Elusimicrobiota bacterium]|nr:hypothetical protein [Elusimicrobiota bacterium]
MPVSWTPWAPLSAGDKKIKSFDGRVVVGAALSGALFFSAGPLFAQILAQTARQETPGSWQLSVYYQGVSDQNLNFNLSGGSGSCQSSNGVNFACGQSGTLSVHGSGDAGLIKAVYQPWDGFQYSAAVGAGYYSLSVPAVNATQNYSGAAAGPVFSLGVQDVIFPDTIVTPAVAVNAGFSGAMYPLDRMNDSAGNVSAVNDTLTLLEYQLGVEASHVFPLDGWKVEPYGGVRWYRVDADLKDATLGSHSGGFRDTLAPVAGLRIPTSDHEGLFAEAAYVGGFQYGGGLSLRF